MKILEIIGLIIAGIIIIFYEELEYCRAKNSKHNTE